MREEVLDMALIRSREGAAQNLTMPLMLVAFVAIGGFLYWLSANAEPTQVLIEEATPERNEGSGGVVSWSDFGVDPESFSGSTITVPGVQVASLLGSQAFWAQLPNETPYLVKLGEALVASGAAVSSGDTGEVTGTVHMMSDSILNAWEAAGAFTDPVNRIEAEFATSFFEAESFVVPPPAGS